MRRLFFDILITGHHPEYLGHLINHCCRHPDTGVNVFVIHPQFKASFPHLVVDANDAQNVQLVEISTDEFKQSTTGSLFKQSFSSLRLVRKYANRYNADCVLLLSFNVFQISLAVIRPKFKVRGILFLQFYRMSTGNWAERLKYVRKFIITKCYSANRQIERVFILNDPNSADYLNRKFRKDLFHVLNDPIPVLKPLHGLNIHDQYNIGPKRRVLLHIGALSDRKGTLEFIQSAAHIQKELQNELAFLIAGSPGGAKMAEQIENQISKVNESTTIEAVYVPGFMSDEKMKSMLDQCYAVVIPYKNPESSSGILGHAAASDKPVIATGKGLLKELIEHYKLGLLIDEVNPELIARKIEALLRHGDWKSESKQFLAERTPANFASTIVA